MKTHFSVLRVAFLGLAFLGACLPSVIAQPVEPKQEKKLVPYRISRSDVLSVDILANGERELSAAQKRVESTGTINLPHIRDVRLIGLTVAEAQEAIGNAYREAGHIRNPVVTVTVETFAPRVVRIGGKVNSQASFEIPPDGEMTIAQLIYRANGFTDTANGRKVAVTRTMADGSIKVFTLNIENFMTARIKSQQDAKDAYFVLQPDDVVFVPEKII